MTYPPRLPPVDDALFAARQELRAALCWHGPVAVSWCSLVPSSGVDLLVQVAAMLRFGRPELRWVVMGDGALLAPLQRLAGGLGVADRIAFTGRLPDGEVMRRLVAADVFMLPARASGDPGPVAVRAGSCGLPVVATPVGIHAGTVARLPHGRLSDDATPEALARATDALLRQCREVDGEAMRHEQRAAARHERALHGVRESGG